MAHTISLRCYFSRLSKITSFSCTLFRVVFLPDGRLTDRRRTCRKQSLRKICKIKYNQKEKEKKIRNSSRQRKQRERERYEFVQLIIYREKKKLMLEKFFQVDGEKTFLQRLGARRPNCATESSSSRSTTTDGTFLSLFPISTTSTVVDTASLSSLKIFVRV